jgi:hypothetical protein
MGFLSSVLNNFSPVKRIFDNTGLVNTITPTLTVSPTITPTQTVTPTTTLTLTPTPTVTTPSGNLIFENLNIDNISITGFSGNFSAQWNFSFPITLGEIEYANHGGISVGQFMVVSTSSNSLYSLNIFKNGALIDSPIFSGTNYAQYFFNESFNVLDVLKIQITTAVTPTPTITVTPTITTTPTLTVTPTVTPTPTITVTPSLTGTTSLYTGSTGTEVEFTLNTLFDAYSSRSGVTTTDGIYTNNGGWQLYYAHQQVTLKSGTDSIGINTYQNGSNSWTWYYAVSSLENVIGSWGSVLTLAPSKSFSYVAGGFNASDISSDVIIPANRYFLIMNNTGPFYRTIKYISEPRTAMVSGQPYVTAINHVCLGNWPSGGTTTIPTQFGGSGTGYTNYQGYTHVHSIKFA